MEKKAFDAGRQSFPHHFRLTVQRDRRSAGQHVACPAFIDGRAANGRAGSDLDLGHQNPAQLNIGFNHEQVIRLLRIQPLRKTGPNLAQRESTFVRSLEKLSDQLIELKLAVQLSFTVQLAYINAAAFAKLDPTVALQLAIGGADRVCMDTKPSRQLARAGRLLPDLQITANYAKSDLRDQLLTQRNFAAV